MRNRTRALCTMAAAALLITSAVACGGGETAGGQPTETATTEAQPTGDQTTTDEPTGDQTTTDEPTGEDSASPEDHGGSSGSGAALRIENFAFTPSTLKASAGATIEVENEDSAPHTFTVDGENVDVRLDGGQSLDVTLDLSPGRYGFHCEIHPEMTGSLRLS